MGVCVCVCVSQKPLKVALLPFPSLKTTLLRGAFFPPKGPKANPVRSVHPPLARRVGHRRREPLHGLHEPHRAACARRARRLLVKGWFPIDGAVKGPFLDENQKIGVFLRLSALGSKGKLILDPGWAARWDPEINRSNQPGGFWKNKTQHLLVR